MNVALIDNGSLEPAAHRNLRAVAAELSKRMDIVVRPVSWKHSHLISPTALDHARAWSLDGWVRTLHADGEREFVFVPFFISAQGAIGSALRADLENLQRQLGGFTFTFTAGLADRGAITEIVADRIRDVIAARFLSAPAVIIVDHGGPSPASASVRDTIAGELRTLLDGEVGLLAAASMEGAEHPHNRPLLAELLRSDGFDRDDVVIAPLFLSPGRHAGPQGDLVQIVRSAGQRTGAPVRYHFTELVGTHPDIVEALARALRDTLPRISDHAAA